MKGLVQITSQPKFAFILVFFCFNFFAFAEETLRIYEPPKSNIGIKEMDDTSFYEEGILFAKIQDYKLSSKDSIAIYKTLAIDYAEDHNAELSAIFAEKYIKASLNINFINNEAFESVSKTEIFGELISKYAVKFSAINFFYLYTALIGLFIALILNFKKTSDRTTNILISFFILMHSIFIFHIFTYRTNLHYRYPQVLFLSIIFSFLYGPIIYFYFKRITQQYKFKWIDILHLIPSLVILILVLPIYSLSSEEKLQIMLKVSSVNAEPFVFYTFIFKLISLLVYGYLLIKIYRSSIKDNNEISNEVFKWQKTVTYLGLTYVFTYIIYGLIISKVIPRYEILYHLQVVAMASMVLYIGVMAYLKPSLFTKAYLKDQIEKYKKSGLTSRFSEELKEQLLTLLHQDKIFKQNDISLEKLAQKLGTTRHNTSQVINEHFNSNFFELINSFRIKEAQQILENDINNNLNIIEVAYEVGFNNKVTFNKSFKKQLAQTPTQYLKTLRLS